MPITEAEENPAIAYQLPMPKDALPEIVVADAIPKDDRLWVKQAENAYFRPWCLNAWQGYWMNLLKVTKSGILSRHRYPNAVHGFVLKGRGIISNMIGRLERVVMFMNHQAKPTPWLCLTMSRK